MKIYKIFLLFTLIFFSCARINDGYKNIIVTIDMENEEFKATDFTNSLGKKIKEKLGKDTKILLMKQDGLYDEVVNNPSEFIKNFNLKSSDKYSFVLSIKPIENQLKKRTEYEMCVASIESKTENREYIKEPVLSPFKTIDWFNENNIKDESNLKKIFIFGEKNDKLLILVNTNDFLRKTQLKNTQKFFEELSGGNLKIELREVSKDILNVFKNNDNSIFDDNFFDDANKAFIFVISSTAKNKNERNFYEALLFGSKADFKKVVEFGAPLNIENFSLDMSIIFKNYSDLKDDVVVYWKMNPEVSGMTFVEYRNYGDFVNLKGNYILINYFDENKDSFEAAYFKENKEKIFEKIYNRIIEERLYNIFYDSENNNLRKIIFFEYITTGNIVIKMVFGPVEGNKVDFYKNELEKIGLKSQGKIVKPSDFR